MNDFGAWAWFDDPGHSTRHENSKKDQEAERWGGGAKFDGLMGLMVDGVDG